MKRLFYILSPLLLLSCITQQYLSPSEVADIPKGSTVIYGHILQKIPSDSIYEILMTNLLEEGFRISHEDKKYYNISTDGKSLTEYGTLVRINFLIKGRLIIARPEWNGGTDSQINVAVFTGINIDPSWDNARFGYKDKPEIAFAYTVKFMKKFCNYLTYE